MWDKPAKGHEVGARLYARKKYMFKGHRWEKVVKLRKKFIALRLRSQKRRIAKWHAVRIIVLLSSLSLTPCSLACAIATPSVPSVIRQGCRTSGILVLSHIFQSIQSENREKVLDARAV